MKIEDALTLLIEHANQDHGGSARCAMFLLSLWDGATYKADLQDLLYNDSNVFQAMMIKPFQKLKRFYDEKRLLNSPFYGFE